LQSKIEERGEAREREREGGREMGRERKDNKNVPRALSPFLPFPPSSSL
jgi:hypothetical protein